ncbi:hypothetical protein [Mesorhizobium sp. M0244]|uniref:hypothetical protein n=1 Tax=Mesorhizobium sp. M0244 TaxID=2956926 RepID=UPI003335811C
MPDLVPFGQSTNDWRNFAQATITDGLDTIFVLRCRKKGIPNRRINPISLCQRATAPILNRFGWD